MAIHDRETSDVVEAFSESTPLLISDSDSSHSTTPPPSKDVDTVSTTEEPNQVISKRSNAATISVLMIGVFVANIDSSLVLATNSAIASSFSQLQRASWLTTSYVMGNCAAQPIVGKLSDIFGRKSVLLVSYALFALGCTICGVGQSMWQVIAGRAIAGLGGAGMTVIVSVLITDLVPKIEIAPWRSYVNVVATTGRTIGGPLGGWLADLIGWRWSFLGQAPLTVLAALLVAYKFKKNVGLPTVGGAKEGAFSKISRIDFLGAGLLSTAIVSFLFAVDLLGDYTSMSTFPLIAMTSAFLILIVAFVVVEINKAKDPIYPIKLLLRRDVATAYLVTILQSGAQLAVMFSVPLYFQVVSEASNSAAGARLIPAFIGNTCGALISGFYIERTGRYKRLTLCASVVACAGYFTMIIRWGGKIHGWEALEIFPGGFGTGMTMASVFISLTSNMPHETIAVATSGLFLSGSLGTVLGVSISSSIQRAVLQYMLQSRVLAEDTKIIPHILADVKYLRTLKGSLKNIVMGSYVESLEFSHGYSLISSFLAFLVALAIHEHPLK